MKKILCVFFIVSLIFCMQITVTANTEVEMVFCDNFEEDISRWTCYGKNTTQRIKLYEDEENEYISSYLQIREDLSIFGWDSDSEEYTLKSEIFEVTPNQEYTIAVDVKSSVSANTKIKLVFMNDQGQELDDGIFETGQFEKKEWNCQSICVKAPEAANKALVCLTYTNRGNDSDYVDFDNVIVCKGAIEFNKDFKKRMESSPLANESSQTVMARENLVFYDTFEKDVSNWSNSKGVTTKKIATSNKEAFTGYKSLRLNSGKEVEKIEAESIMFNIVPGTEYKLKCNLFISISNGLPSTSADKLNVYMKFYDKDKREVSSQFMYQELTGKWTEKELSVVAPQNALYGKVVVVNNNGIKEYFVDNIKVYGEKGTGNAADYENKEDYIMKNSVILFVDSPNAYVNGNKTFIDKNDKEVKAYTLNGRTLVPVRFIAESFGAEVLWDEEEKKVTLTLPEKISEIKIDENLIRINGEEFEIDVPAITERGRTMLPLRALTETVMGKTVFWDNRGLIVISDKEILNEKEDREIIDKLIENIK